MPKSKGRRPSSKQQRSRSKSRSRSRSRSRSKPSRSKSKSPSQTSTRGRRRVVRSREPIPIADLSAEAQADAARALKAYMDTTDIRGVLTAERAKELVRRTAPQARAIPPTRRNVEDLINRTIRNAQADSFYTGYKDGLEHVAQSKKKK